MNIKAYIENTEFFAGISDEGKELLSEICIPKNLEKKETLFHEGDAGSAFYLMGGGTVGLYKGAEDGRDVVIKMVGRGEIFAEVVLFEQNRYPVTAVALKPSLVFMIPRVQFTGLLGDERFRNDFMKMLMRKQRYLAGRIKYLTMHDVEERFFLFLTEHYGSSTSIRLTFSKKDIAAAIGTTPETYSRLIARLSAEGKVAVEGKTIEILPSGGKSRHPGR
jgi:CRP/FNR family transcriptional regulator